MQPDILTSLTTTDVGVSCFDESLDHIKRPREHYLVKTTQEFSRQKG